VGEERGFAQWSGFATPTFRPASIPMQSLVGRLIPDIDIDLDPEDPRANRALDWYLKSLTANFETDQFIFLWIASEILAANSGFEITEPYVSKCGHQITDCPQCGSPTERPVQGQSMKRWLVQGFGVDHDLAERMWQARQVLHGAQAFDSEIMENLTELVQCLRAVVVTSLKQRLGMPDDQPPFAFASGLSISAGMQGMTKVSEQDLNPASLGGRRP
jgi:hypothetical protein